MRAPFLVRPSAVPTRTLPTRELESLLTFAGDVNAWLRFAVTPPATSSWKSASRSMIGVLDGERLNVQPARARWRARELSRAAADHPVRAFAHQGQLACAGALLACRDPRRRWRGVVRAVVSVVDHDPVCVSVLGERSRGQLGLGGAGVL